MGPRSFGYFILVSGVVNVIIVPGCQPPPNRASVAAETLPEGVTTLVSTRYTSFNSRLIVEASTGDFIVSGVQAISPALFRVTPEGRVTTIALGPAPGLFTFVLENSGTGDLVVGGFDESVPALGFLWRVSPDGDLMTFAADEALGFPIGAAQDHRSGDLFVIGVDTWFGGPSENPRLVKVSPDGTVTIVASALPLTYPVDVVGDISTGDLIVVDDPVQVVIDAEGASLVRVSQAGDVTTISTDIPIQRCCGITQDAASGDLFLTAPAGAVLDEGSAVLRVTTEGAVSTIISGQFLYLATDVARDGATGDLIVVSYGFGGPPSHLFRIAGSFE